MWDRLCQTIAWRMPRRLCYWCAIRVGVNATQGAYSNQVVPELRVTDALKRWMPEAR